MFLLGCRRLSFSSSSFDSIGSRNRTDSSKARAPFKFPFSDSPHDWKFLFLFSWSKLKYTACSSCSKMILNTSSGHSRSFHSLFMATDFLHTHPKRVELVSNVELSENEKKIFDFLLKVTLHFGTKTVLRVAGGWVRDKLLGNFNHDIDIALDNMMGKEFAEQVNQYCQLTGQPTHNVGLIRCNPEQSKHLETATMKIFDLWIDFVNLRTEEYSQSRIPVTKIGNAKEDAFRRDLTINSLFYNINEGKVEDFTEKGLDDLRNGMIRTPLPPSTTFLDDPLRVLRAIRFACRYNFDIDAELCNAACGTEVRDALRKKVSRERIGSEIKAIFKGNALRGFLLLYKFQLYDIVFEVPSESAIPEIDFREKSLIAMAQMERFLALQQTLPMTFDDRIYLLLAAFFSNLQKLFYLNKKKKKEPLIRFIILEALKFPLKDAEAICSLINRFQEFDTYISRDLPLENASRKEVGVLIRRAGPLWKHAALLATALRLPPLEKSLFEEKIPEHDRSIVCFEHFIAMVDSMGLQEVWNWKPLIAGNEILDIFRKPPGAWVAETLDLVMEWQLENPEKTSEDCKQWLLGMKKSQDYQDEKSTHSLSIAHSNRKMPSKKLRKSNDDIHDSYQ